MNGASEISLTTEVLLGTVVSTDSSAQPQSYL